jgi:hypothetical protein
MCDCIEKVNKELEKRGLRLDVAFNINFEDGSVVNFIPLYTEKINPKNRKTKLATISPTYCPICGEKINYI